MALDVIFPTIPTTNHPVVYIGLFLPFFIPFTYNGVYSQPTKNFTLSPPPTTIYLSTSASIVHLSHTHLLTVLLVLLFPKVVCRKRASEMIVPSKEMLLSFSIGTFLTNYDITIRKQYKGLIYSIVQKGTF